jgi:predicted nucleotidyltransferase
MGTQHQPAGLAGALFSQVRLRVLGLLIGHPEQGYQLTEVIRLVGSGRGAVQRELESLTKSGILNLVATSNRKVYRANRESPIFEELHRLILKTVGLLEPLKTALGRYKSNIDVAFVYGSVAKGEDTAKSDIDLMILGHDLAYDQIYGALQKAEKLLLRAVNPNLMTMMEWREKLLSKNAFVTKIIGQPKLFIFGTENELKRT